MKLQLKNRFNVWLLFHNKYLFVVVLPCLLLFLDQLTKSLVRSAFDLHEQLILIPGLLSLRYEINTGTLWGLFQGNNIFFTLFSIAIIVIIILTLSRVDGAERHALGFVLAGAFGNTIDRVFLGHVTDFIDISFWPGVFNVADACITVGIVIMIIANFFPEQK